MSVGIPYGYCKCGCGQKTTIASTNMSREGYSKGEPKDFVHGHHARGSNHPNWKGGRFIERGYVRLRRPDHPDADANGYVLEHRLIAARALGRPLPEGAEVHHVNGVKDDNRPGNLVVCEDNAYHTLLHCRTTALKESGHAHWRKCRFCGEWDDPEKMYVGPHRNSHHRSCANAYNRALEAEA